MKKICFLALFWFLLSTNIFADNSQIITIIGNERIDRRTIESYVDIKSLQTGDGEVINEALKKLYESDLFSLVNISKQKNQIIIDVKENPIVSEVEFDGNKKIEDKSLLAEVRLQKRSVYTKNKLESDIKRINDIYIKSGRFLTKIDPQIILQEQNRVKLIFKIYEGKPAKIGDIYFIGNHAFGNQDLIDEIASKKAKWYKFLASSDIYDSDRVQFDKEKLRRFYNAHGYADFSILSAISEITPNKDKFFITFLLEEGIKYNFGEIKIINNVKKFDEKLLANSIYSEDGKIYNADLVEKSVDQMVQIMSEHSYAFADIEPVLKRNKETQIIDIDYVINETPKIYINQIRIYGNYRTLDEVIRRELRVREGDPYNLTKINRSRQRISNLGFFDKVDFKSRRIGNSDKVDLEIEVKEKKTGELNFGIGYSTVDRATVSVGIKERNLMGTGKEIGLNLQKSSRGARNQISFTSPYFTGREIDVGFDIFNYESDKLRSLIYDQKSNGVTLRGDYSIIEYLTHQIRYSLHDDKISDVSVYASPVIQSLEGSYINSGVGQTFLFDKRDNRFDPKDGYYISISQDYAGVGGDLKYLKHEGSAGYYVPIFTEDFVFKLSAKFGYIEGIGQDIKSNNNFFLGGNNFRGFEYAGLGPRTRNSNGSAVGGAAVGGKLYYVNTTELRFPLGLPKELGINASLFNDIGTVRLVDPFNKTQSSIADTGSLRDSYGLSLIWASPMGPIRLDFSRIARKEKFDRVENFRFSFGTTF